MTYQQLLSHMKALPPSVKSVEAFLRLYFGDEFVGGAEFDVVCRNLAIAGDLTYQDTYWDDLQGILGGINPVGPASPPTADPLGEGWRYDAVSTEVAVVGVQTRHAGVEGGSIYPHIHWRKTTAAAGDVMWQLDGKHASPGGDFGAYALVATESAPVPGTIDNDTSSRHLITSFGEYPMPDTLLSTLAFFKLSRLGGDALDTYGADALAMSFDCHYAINSPGSREEFTK